MSFSPESLPDLTGKIFLVTGGNSGIGYCTVFHLVKHNAKIKAEIPNANVVFLKMDLMNLASVVSAANEFLSKESRLYGLVNNAGVMATAFELTPDGFEAQWETNYLSHWVLTQHLLQTLLATAKASHPGDVRIVNVTSNGHSMAPKGGIDFNDINQLKGGVWSRYGQSKLANILFTKELNRRYGPASSAASKIWTASVHPGAVDTQLNTQVPGMAATIIVPILKCAGVYAPPEHGAYSSLFCIASSDFQASQSGAYFVPTAKVGKPSDYTKDVELACKLWTWTDNEMRSKNFI